MLRVLPPTFKPVSNLIYCKTGFMLRGCFIAMLHVLPPTFKPVSNLICCKTGFMLRGCFIAMLHVLPPTFKPVSNLICCKTGFMLVVKRATSLYKSFCSNVARQVARFLLPVFPYLKNI